MFHLPIIVDPTHDEYVCAGSNLIPSIQQVVAPIMPLVTSFEISPTVYNQGCVEV